MKEFIEYYLKSPVTINHNGVEDSCTSLKIYSPELKQEDQVLALCQYVSLALMDSAKHVSPNREPQSDSESKEMDGKAIITLMMASEVDIKRVISVFKSIILSAGTVLQPFGAALNSDSVFNKISLEDKLNLLGDYLANFIVSLVMPN